MENFDEKSLIVSETPHLRSYQKTSKIMLRVFLALLPAAIFGVVAFGLRALSVMVVSIVSCLLAESVFHALLHQKNTIGDGSALVTGLLLAMNLSPAMAYASLWKVALGGVFAIVVVKMLFGGLGNNFMNPALAARAFLMASFAGDMTTWYRPFSHGMAITCATPLGGAQVTLKDAFLGNVGGCIGEVSALLLLLGGLYLIFSKVITIHMPLAFLSTVAVLTFFTSGFQGDAVLMALCSGGLMLGAFFMATDYVTSPITHKGMVAGGVLCGILTVVIRTFGGYPEGVSYSILLMNVATPFIDRLCKNKRFGEVSAWQKKRRA